MQFVNYLLVAASCVLFGLAEFVKTESLGDSCMDNNNLRGKCMYIFDCPYVIQLKLSERQYHKCGFHNQKEVVCCGQRDLLLLSTQSPPPDRRYVRECEKNKADSFDSEIFFTSLTAQGRPSSKIASNCSQYSYPLVVGGENAKPKEFPHMALLGCKDNNGKLIWICGGSLISSNFILTAAHCFKASQCENVTLARLGELNVDITTDDAQPKDYDIANIISHPEYDNNLKYNDIALVRINKRADINSYIRPACLPYFDYTNQSQLIITGWGSTEHAGLSSPDLQKAGVDIFDQQECNEIFAEEEDNTLPVGVKERTQICAGSKTSAKDTCQGDSGGPLQTIHPNYPCMFTIIGITSYGQACGVQGVPGVYTRVFHYTDWIEKVVWP